MESEVLETGGYLLNPNGYDFGGQNGKFWTNLSGRNESLLLEEFPYFPAYIRTTSTIFCTLILIIGIIGNALVPWVVWRNKDLRSSTNIFLVNLSLADLLVLIVCVPTGLVELHTEPEVWLLGPTMCKLVPFAELSVAHASVLTILAISLERYIAICRPLRANYTCTKERAVLLCIIIWIVGFLSTSPMLGIAKHKELQYIDRSIRPACLMEARHFWSTFYFLSSIAIFFFLPLFLLIGLYWVISRSLMSDPCNISLTSRQDNGGEHPNMRARKQVVMMLGTVVFFFFICLLPFRILSVYIILAPHASLSDMGEEVYYNILYFCRLMHYFNSAINPILYNVMSSKFRTAFLKVLGCTLHPTSDKSRWLRRHLNRQSTFNTTSSTLVHSSVKSNGAFQSRRLSRPFDPENKGNGSTVLNGGGGSTVFRNGGAAIYFPPSATVLAGRPLRQMSSEGVSEHSRLPFGTHRKKSVMIRANSVL